MLHNGILYSGPYTGYAGMSIKCAASYSDHILRSTLHLFMENHFTHPLPTPEEVLVCYPSTSAEEVCIGFPAG